MRKKIAILGGGCGAMTAAYYLSNTPELQNRFEVTVYQMGWRLGGKGASGRNAAIHDRIEEHGLHVWGGFYYNAFRMMRECYGALGRDVWGMFQPHDLVAWGEEVNGAWLTWRLNVPSTPGQKPGEGPIHPSLWDQLRRLIGWIRDAIHNWPHAAIAEAAHDPARGHHEFRLVAEAIDSFVVTSAAEAIEASHALVSRLAEQPEGHAARDYAMLLRLLRGVDSWLEREIVKVIDSHNESRRLFVLIDLGLALVSGIIEDGLWYAGFMKVDDYDLAQWLGKHGAVQLSLESAPLRGYYDYFFAYENGDASKPRMSAGMGIAHLLRLIADYRGSLFWKMESGMGDAVFAPLYELCVRNGVKFEFFHRVEGLVPSAGGNSIDAIRINRQVTLKRGIYDPLVHPNIPSWPSEPNWSYIDDAEVAEIKRRGVNLEDPWADWAGTPIELRAGRDYDAIVLGLSIGAFGMVCRDILARDPLWKTMVASLQTIQTQAMQLWWKKPVGQLGWTWGNATGTAYAHPYESWSDMSEALVHETWPTGPESPQSVVYFCGPMLNPPSMPGGVDPGYGRAEWQKARDNALAWVKSNLAILFPGVTWDDYVDLGGGAGEARFDAQYVRANYTPTERYVLDLPGTNKDRLEADTSGYANLALAGDWLFTGLGGAVESAVISGMQAARALAGSITDPIAGEVRSPWRRPQSIAPLKEES